MNFKQYIDLAIQKGRAYIDLPIQDESVIKMLRNENFNVEIVENQMRISFKELTEGTMLWYLLKRHIDLAIKEGKQYIDLPMQDDSVIKLLQSEKFDVVIVGNITRISWDKRNQMIENLKDAMYIEKQFKEQKRKILAKASVVRVMLEGIIYSTGGLRPESNTVEEYADKIYNLWRYDKEHWETLIWNSLVEKIENRRDYTLINRQLRLLKCFLEDV